MTEHLQIRAVRRPSWIVWAAIVAIGVIVLWMGTPFVVRLLYPEDVATRGQFGDIFGSVNALFSGLALTGVIIAILLQREDTRILQRAYISVEGASVKGTRDATTGLFTTGQLLGHVEIKNVGHLPASQVKWHLEITPNSDPDWTPPVREAERDLGGLHLGVSIRRGSGAIAIPTQGFIYVWGRVTYLDGFGRPRFTNFCHRYNTVNAGTSSEGRYRIKKGDARQHDNGNEFS